MPNDSNNFSLVCHLDIFSYMLMITFKKSQHRGFLSTQISTSAVAASSLYTRQIRGYVYYLRGSCIQL